MACACEKANRRTDSTPVALGAITDGRVTVVARAAGLLEYPLRGAVERVDARTLADGLETLVGRNVERGHGGPVIGKVEAARQDGDRILCDLLITDAEAREDIQARRLDEASADYLIGGLDTDGTQRGPFQYFALALIPPGVSRCGPTCSIERPEHEPNNRLDCLGMKISIAGKEYTAGTPEAAEAMAAEVRRMDADASAVATLRRERSARIRLDAKRAGVTARADAGDDSVMVDTVAKVFPGVDLSGQSPDYIAGAFAVAIASLLASKDAPKDGAKPGAEDAPGAAPPAEGAAGARADALDGRGRKDAAEIAPALPPDVLMRQNMIRKGQSLKPTHTSTED